MERQASEQAIQETGVYSQLIKGIGSTPLSPSTVHMV